MDRRDAINCHHYYTAQGKHFGKQVLALAQGSHRRQVKDPRLWTVATPDHGADVSADSTPRT